MDDDFTMTKAATKRTVFIRTRIVAFVFIALGIAGIGGAIALGVIGQNRAASNCVNGSPGMTATPEHWAQITTDLKNIVADGQVIGGEQERLANLVCQREVMAAPLASSNPDSLAAAPLSDAEQATAAAALGTPVDEHGTVAGIFQILASDNLRDQAEKMTITLVTSDQEQLLAWPANIEQPKPGSSVQVTGVIIGETLVVQSFVDQPVVSAPGAVRAASLVRAQSLTGPHRVLVAMVYFAGQEAPTDLTHEDITDRFFSSTAPSVKDYFSNMSRQQFELTGDVVGWYPSTDENPSTFNGIVSSALQAVRVNDPAIDFRTYEYFVVVAPYTNNNLSDGMAYVGKISTWTPDGYVTAGKNIIRSFNLGSAVPGIDVEPANIYVAAHEFGHQLGLWHASLSYCTSVPFATDCPVWEYGDYYDLMDGRWELQSAIGLNSPHRDYFGWLNPDEIQTVTATGDYELVPLEVTTPGVKTLKLMRATGRWMYIEYRQPIGYDEVLSNTKYGWSSPTTGLEFYDVPSSTNRTYLLDPKMNVLGYSPLDVGQQVTDPLTGTVISVNSRTADSISVHVDYHAPIVYPTMLLQTPTANSSYAGTVPFTATATHGSGIAQVEFWRSDVATPLAVDTTAPYSFNYDVSAIPAGTVLRVYMLAQAVDGTRASTAPWNVTVLTPPGLDAAPTVAITAPAPATFVSSPVTLFANINDDLGVSTSKFYIDCPAGYALASCSHTYVGSPYTLVRSLASGQHTLTVVGYDYTGHTTTVGPVNFTVDSANPTVSGFTVSAGSSSITLTATASDDVGLKQVEFYQESELLGFDDTAPYSWTLTAASLSAGLHTFGAKATDLANKTSALTTSVYNHVVAVPATSSPVTTLPGLDAAPTVAITAPVTTPPVAWPTGISAAVSSTAGKTTTLRGRATVTINPAKTSKITLKEVNITITGSTKVYRDIKTPFAIAFDSSTFRNGKKTITITAIDTTGQRYQKTKRVTFDNPLAVKWKIAKNTVLRRTVKLSPSIRGGTALIAVEYRVDGRLIGKRTKSPYALSWNTRRVKKGRHTILVKVTTSDKKQATAAVVIQVRN